MWGEDHAALSQILGLQTGQLWHHHLRAGRRGDRSHSPDFLRSVRRARKEASHNGPQPTPGRMAERPSFGCTVHRARQRAHRQVRHGSSRGKLKSALFAKEDTPYLSEVDVINQEYRTQSCLLEHELEFELGLNCTSDSRCTRIFKLLAPQGGQSAAMDIKLLTLLRAMGSRSMNLHVPLYLAANTPHIYCNFH